MIVDEFGGACNRRILIIATKKNNAMGMSRDDGIDRIKEKFNAYQMVEGERYKHLAVMLR